MIKTDKCLKIKTKTNIQDHNQDHDFCEIRGIVLFFLQGKVLNRKEASGLYAQWGS